MILVGKILKIFDEKILNANFKKRLVLIKTDCGNEILIEFRNKKSELFLKKFFEESSVEIIINIKSKKVLDKYYNFILGKDIRFKDKEKINLSEKVIQLLKLGTKVEFIPLGVNQFKIKIDNQEAIFFEDELNNIGMTRILKQLENNLY